MDALAKRLKQFYSGEVEAKKVIEKYLRENPRASTAEAFRVLSSGRGNENPCIFLQIMDRLIFTREEKERGAENFMALFSRKPKIPSVKKSTIIHA